MRSRRWPALITAAVVAACAVAASAAAVGRLRPGTSRNGGAVISSPSASSTPATAFAPAPAAEQTHPVVLPRRGRRFSRFAIYLTLREAPGHRGVLATDYRMGVAAPPRSPARCRPTPPSKLEAGYAGEAVRVALKTPAGGWCVGRYTATVFLQRGPYCPSPPAGPPTPCPEFASQDLDVGQARFTVLASR